MTTTGIDLTPDQRDILNCLITTAEGNTIDGVVTLSGFAGTGKTTLVAELVRRLAGKGLRIAVTAFTHKAVTVLSEKIGFRLDDGIVFQTASWLIGWKVKEMPDGTTTCKPSRFGPRMSDFDLAIIDEASMIGEEMFSAIVSGRGPCRVIFVGDPYQVPPVGDEAKTPLAFSHRVPVQYQLDEVIRQEKDNPIIRWTGVLRSAIDRDEGPSLADLATATAGCEQREDCAAVIAHGAGLTAVEWALWAIKQRQQTRILAFDNQTVLAYNRAIHDRLFGADLPFGEGECVVCNSPFESEDKRTAFRNGEVLTVISAQRAQSPAFPDIPAMMLALHSDDQRVRSVFVAIDQQGLRAYAGRYFEQHRRDMELAKNPKLTPKERSKWLRDAEEESRVGWSLLRTFADIRHWYAMTVHKAQGSTFDTALIDWPSIERSRFSPADRSRLLYVAVTRPRKNALILT